MSIIYLNRGHEYWNFYKDLLRLDSMIYFDFTCREILNNFCYNYEKSDMC